MLSVSRMSVFALWLCPSDITEVAFALHAEDDEGKGASRSSLRLASNTSLSSRRLDRVPTADYVGVFGTVEADDFQEFHGSRQWTCGDGDIQYTIAACVSLIYGGADDPLLVGDDHGPPFLPRGWGRCTRMPAVWSAQP